MPTKLMMIFVATDVIFAACGGLLIGFSLMAEQTLRADPTKDNVGQNVLLRQCPLTGTTPPLSKPPDALDQNREENSPKKYNEG
jgi:hypothetical protein